MSSETQFSVQVTGSAEAAYQVNESRHCVMDLTTILLETQDNVRQIHMLNHVLGIRSRMPTPPAGLPPQGSPRPRPQSLPRESQGQLTSDGGDAAMYVMAAISPSSALAEGDSGVFTGPFTLSTTHSSRTFTPVSTMRRLAHAVSDDLSMDRVAANALDFVAAWRREDQKCAAHEDVIHDCLTASHVIELAEQEGRWRLQHLLVTVTEQLHRFVLLAEYDKFSIFCMENEPVWRQAARQLQKENDARLNTTENIYARFLFEDTVMADKTRMFQEAADYVVSLHLVEREQRSIAKTTAMARRRRQSASQMVTPTSTPQGSGTRRAEAGPVQPTPKPNVAAAPAATGNSSDGAVNHNRRRETVPATSQVTPMTAVEVDNYKEGWRAMMGHLTNGERGAARTSNAHATAAPVLPAAAAAAAKSSDDKRRTKSPPRKQEAAKAKSAASPSPKELKKSDRARSPKEDKDRRTPLPPVVREEKKSKETKEDPRAHRHSSRDTATQQGGSKGSEEAAARQAKAEEKKTKEVRPVAVNAAPPRRAEETREERHHRHHHREAKAHS